MKCKHSAWREMSPVERNSFAGEQVQRNRVSGECINNEDIVILRRLVFESDARVTLENLDLRAGVSNVGEEISSDWLNSRVDLVEGELISRLAVCCKCSGTKADNTDIFRAMSCGARTAVVERKTDAGFLRVVGCWRGAKFGCKPLCAVLDGAVLKTANR